MDNVGDDFFGTDEEFEQRIKEFKDRCRKQCYNVLKRTKNKILRQKFAVIVLFFSIVTFCVGLKICVSAPSKFSVIAIIYSITFACCSIFSLLKPRGYTAYSENDPENKRLLSPSNPHNRSSHMSLEDVMEPRQGSGIFEARSPYQVNCEVDRSLICEPLNYDDSSPSHCPARSSPKLIYGENSEGTSSAPDPFPPLSYEDDSFVRASHKSRKAVATTTSEDLASGDSFEHITYSFPASHCNDGSNDLGEPIQRLSEARLSVDAINTFGNPVGILGADKFIIFQGSDDHTFESSSSSGPFDESKVKTLEVSVEVHPYTRRQNSSGNDGSSSGEPAALAGNETALIASSDHGDSIKQFSSSSSEEPIGRDEAAQTQVLRFHGDLQGSFDVHKVKSSQVSVEIHSNSSRPISSNNDGSSSSEPASVASDETAQTSISDSRDIVPGSFDVEKVKPSQISVEVEVHPYYSSRQISSNNDDSSSSEFASMVSNETAQTPVSDLNEDIPFIDD